MPFKNYTVKDWCQEVACLFLFIGMAQTCFRDLMNERYLRAVTDGIGMAGWGIIYMHINKSIRKKNK